MLFHIIITAQEHCTMAHAGVHGEVHVFRVNICKQVGKNKEKYTAKAGDENLATKDTSLSYTPSSSAGISQF